MSEYEQPSLYEPDETPEIVDYDDEDVPAALARTTHDGPGFADESELPPSDFIGYEDPNAEGEPA